MSAEWEDEARARANAYPDGWHEHEFCPSCSPLIAERVRQARAEAALAAPEVAAALHALAGTTVHTGQSIENAARMLADVIRADAEGGQP